MRSLERECLVPTHPGKKVVPYSITGIGVGTDPGFLAVTWS